MLACMIAPSTLGYQAIQNLINGTFNYNFGNLATTKKVREGSFKNVDFNQYKTSAVPFYCLIANTSRRRVIFTSTCTTFVTMLIFTYIITYHISAFFAFHFHSLTSRYLSICYVFFYRSFFFSFKQTLKNIKNCNLNLFRKFRLLILQFSGRYAGLFIHWSPFFRHYMMPHHSHHQPTSTFLFSRIFDHLNCSSIFNSLYLEHF